MLWGGEIFGIPVFGVPQTKFKSTAISNNTGIRIFLLAKAQLVLADSVIKDNTDWGLAAYVKQCGIPLSYDDFTGQVLFGGKNIIEGNNKSGNQNGKGNPGNHPFKNLPDGQVCLP